ncbi:MAG: sulfotransferase domain-containing protein, partial [Thermomicrobiales bacterium]
MRIVVASPPKSGNHWIKCLLAEIYGLTVIEGEDKQRLTADAIPAWVDAGGFPDGSIIHIHNKCTERLCNAIEAIPASIVTIIRDPYDAFLSMYYWTQQRSERQLDNRQGRPRQSMAGKALDDPAVLEFLGDSFGTTIEQGVGWLTGGRAHVVRYEALHADAAGVLHDLTGVLAPVPTDAVERAIRDCRAEVMRQRDQKMQWHIRSGKVG